METRAKRFLAVAALGLAFALSSCASSDNTTSDDDHVSTIPWNHPEKGENSSGLPNISSDPGSGGF